MFKCELGKHISKPLEKQVKVTVAKRTRIYKLNEDETVTGFEIVKEINSCALHAVNYKEDAT
jgi:hypothetical protein